MSTVAFYLRNNQLLAGSSDLALFAPGFDQGALSPEIPFLPLTATPGALGSWPPVILAKTTIGLYDSGSSIGTASFTTGSFTVPNNCLLVVAVTGISNGNTSVNGNLTMTASGGWSFGLPQSIGESLTNGNEFSAIFTASVTTGGSTTLTVDSGADNIFEYLLHVLYARDGSANIPTVGATGSYGDTTGASPQSFNLSGTTATTSVLVSAGLADGGAGTVGIPSGWTAEKSYSTNFFAKSATVTGVAQNTVTWANLNHSGAQGVAASAIEIQQVTAGTQSPFFNFEFSKSAPTAAPKGVAKDGLNLNLIGQDTFFGGAGQPPQNEVFSIALSQRGVAIAWASQNLLLTLLAQQSSPFQSAAFTSLQIPIVPDFNLPGSLNLNLLGQDQIFGGAGQPVVNVTYGPTRAAPSVSAWQPPNLLLTLLAGTAAAPFINPFYAAPSVAWQLRPPATPLNLNLISQDQFFGAAGQAPFNDRYRSASGFLPSIWQPQNLLLTLLAPATQSPFATNVFSLPPSQSAMAQRPVWQPENLQLTLLIPPFIPATIASSYPGLGPQQARAPIPGLNLNLIGKDTIFGAAGQVPRSDQYRSTPGTRQPPVWQQPNLQLTLLIPPFSPGLFSVPPSRNVPRGTQIAEWQAPDLSLTLLATTASQAPFHSAMMTLPPSIQRMATRSWQPSDLLTSTLWFPPQITGLRVFDGISVIDLSMVALTDAPSGNRLEIWKNGVAYAVYLVPTTDANASRVRINTSTGVKSIRLKT